MDDIAHRKELVEKLYKRISGRLSVIQALADHERLKILVHLGIAGTSRGMNVTELTAVSRLSRPAMSHHLKLLKDCGLLQVRKVGTQCFYVFDAEKHLEAIKETVEMFSETVKGADNSMIPDSAEWLLKLIEQEEAERQ